MPDDETKHQDPLPEAKSGVEGTPPDDDAEAFRPEGIAARVNRVGTESDIERAAEDEEAKLYERKRKDKTALETAASKRLAKIGEGNVKRPSAATGVSAEADPLVRRAVKATSWVQEHQQTFVAMVVVGLLGAGGFAGYTYWQEKRNGAASMALAQALADEHGHISEKAAADDDDDTRAKPLYPTFKSAAERRDAALAKYRAVETKFPGTGAAILARLGEASLLLDAGDAKGAEAEYQEVIASPLAKADAEVRGRALEGVGFAEEALAGSDEAGKAKHLEDALAAYKKLAEVDVVGFKELGQYHQARVIQTQGDTAKAIEILKDVQKRVAEPGDDEPFPYLKFVLEDRLRELDPTALPPKPRADASGKGGPGAAAAGGGANKVDMNDPQIQKLIEQLRQKSGTPPGGPSPGGAAPAGAPGPGSAPPAGGPTP